MQNKKKYLEVHNGGKTSDKGKSKGNTELYKDIFKYINDVDPKIIQPSIINKLQIPFEQKSRTYEEIIKSNTKPNKIPETERGMTMDEGYKKLIDRLDQDIRDHKQEIRERDLQTQQELRDREKRFHDSVQDSTNRISQLLQDQKENINLKLDRLYDNLNQVQTDMSNMTQRVDNIHGRVDSLKYFIIGSVITLLLGIGGIVYANWQVISSMLELGKK